MNSLKEYKLSTNSKRLMFKTFEAQDITDDYIESLNNTKLMKLTSSLMSSWCLKDIVKYVEDNNASNNSLLVGAFDRLSGKHIGNIRLHNFSNRHSHIELGIMITNQDNHGKGYGTEMIQTITNYIFNHLSINKVYADYFSINTPSEKMFQKSGFIVEGILKDHFIVDNVAIDKVCIAKFRFRSNEI